MAFLIQLALVLFVVGFALIFLALARGSSSRARGGAFILVGPVPIFLGGRKGAFIALAVLLVLVIFFVGPLL